MPPEITFLFGFATAFALMFIYRRGFSRGRKETGHVAATRETETRNDYQSQVDHLRQRPAVPERITTDPATDRKSTRLNSSHQCASRLPSSACNKTPKTQN